MYIENNNHDQQYYLKRMAALQFPGSRENYDTRQPLHLLQQQSSDRSLERRFWNAYQDDQLEGAYYSLAGHDNEEYHNIEELAMAYLGIDNEEDIDDYNADRLEFDETPFRKMRDNEDEFDYLSALDIPIFKLHFSQYTKIASLTNFAVPSPPKRSMFFLKRSSQTYISPNSFKMSLLQV